MLKSNAQKTHEIEANKKRFSKLILTPESE